MKKFETGKTYEMRSICDHNCIWTYEVIARTERTITLKDDRDNVKKCRVQTYGDTEIVKPLGGYSMCPILRA